MTAKPVIRHQPISERERCEQDVAREGITWALQHWPVEDVHRAVDRIVAANGTHEGMDAAADETAARYAGVTHEYRNFR
jgi:hypothetical protein